MKQRLASARELRTRLADLPVPGSFSDVELEGLPDPVRRHFKEAIAPGTPLATSARFPDARIDQARATVGTVPCPAGSRSPPRIRVGRSRGRSDRRL